MKILTLLSGGLDSTVLLYHLLDRKTEVEAVSFDYGQRHRREISAANLIADRTKVKHHLVTVNFGREGLAGSALTDSIVPVPHGHYADESMKQTVVPNRNMILLSIAAGLAISRQCRQVGFAAHAGDHAIYPDCRPDFVDNFNRSLFAGTYQTPLVTAPFIHLTKRDIVSRGQKLRVPMELTWSCYEGKEVHCGKCGTCVERREAFKDAIVDDPTVYDGD